MLNKFQIISNLLSLRAPALGCLNYTSGKRTSPWALKLLTQQPTLPTEDKGQLVLSSRPCFLQPKLVKRLRNIQKELKLPAFSFRTRRNDRYGVLSNFACSSGHLLKILLPERPMILRLLPLSREDFGSAGCASGGPSSPIYSPMPLRLPVSHLLPSYMHISAMTFDRYA